MLHDENISPNNIDIEVGNPCPPYSLSQSTLVHPSSLNLLKAAANPFGVVTEPSLSLQPSISPVLFKGKRTSEANFPAI